MHMLQRGSFMRGVWQVALLAAVVWFVLISPAKADIIYTIEDGDSAWSIAVRFGVSLEALYEANGWACDENPVLQIGQKIAIPTDREDVEVESDTADGEVTEETTYIVQPGDNPYMIAHRFGVGTLALLEYNGLTEDDLIHPGQLLSIPPGDYRYQGNAEAVEETGEEAEPTPEPLHYLVQPDDNPWAIARRFGINLQTLLSYNGLTETAILHVGDELLIPADAGSLSSRSASWGSHTVRRGDTLSGIASEYGVSVVALAEANNISVDSILREGQQLIVPVYRSTSVPQETATPAENPPAPAPPPPPRDYSTDLSPLPGLNGGGAGAVEDLSGWHSEIFDFTRIETPEPSTPDPREVSEGTLSTDGCFDDGTPYHLYTVRRGDTISEVAHAFGITQSELINRNGLDLRSTLRIGRDLKIPLPRPPAPPSPSNSGSSVTWGAPSVPIGDASGTELGRAVVEEATKYLGTPYVWAGSSLTGGADCSGFTMAVYSLFGIDLPHRSRDQAECGVEVEYSELQPGDLVFFHTTRSGISHVGMYIGNGDFIHSSSHRGGVVISPLDTGYYNTRFVCARRVI